MLKRVSAIALGILLCYMYGVTLFDRKTIVLNSSRMKRLNNDIIKVDNRCYKVDKNVEKCEKDEE